MKTSCGVVSVLLIASLAAPVMPVRAEMLRAATTDRERVAAVLAREDVRAELFARGVDIAEVNRRTAVFCTAYYVVKGNTRGSGC